MQHKAIETVYAGHRFRSRLEARWAVFFDHMGIDWRYESEGFERDGKRYLPDFFLPRTRHWVEVKGDPNVMIQEAIRLGEFLRDGTALPDFEFSSEPVIGGGLILLGDIPRCGCLVMHKVIQHTPNDGLLATRGFFFRYDDAKPGHFAVDPPTAFATMHGVYAVKHAEQPLNEKEWANEPLSLACCRAIGTDDAYKAARSARFEFGERG